MRHLVTACFAFALAASCAHGAGEGEVPLAPERCALEGACGDASFALAPFRPNIYFVVDRSGSMQAEVPVGTVDDADSPFGDLLPAPGPRSSYEVVRQSAMHMMTTFGPAINVGAAVYPSGEECAAGRQVMSLRRANDDAVEAFGRATEGQPKGGSPLFSTLRAIYGELAKLEGDTHVVLLTDGNPNCNSKLDCADAEPFFNPTKPTHCLDLERTVNEIHRIRDTLNIAIHPVSVAIAKPHHFGLREMADAGGTEPRYVEDEAQLSEVLFDIVHSAISCDLPVDVTPDGRDFTSVYLDCNEIARDHGRADEPPRGWSWLDTTTVRLHGEACERIKTGVADEVLIVSGCATESLH